MESSFTLKAALAWAVMAVIAIANGITRGLYEPYMSDAAAHAVSSLILITIFALIIRGFVIRNGPLSTGSLIALGVGWTLATITFEFAFGTWVVGRDLDYLLADYDLLSGRTWPLVLFTVLLAPLVFGRGASSPGSAA